MPITIEWPIPNLKIEWPTKHLTKEQLELIAAEQSQKPLNDSIARLLIEEGDVLWQQCKMTDPSTPFNRSNSDLAINSGYKEVARVILSRDSSAPIFQKDPIGLALLNMRLQEMKRAGYFLDVEAIGFGKGMERFHNLYTEAVKSGIASDVPRATGRISFPFPRVPSGIRRVFSGAAS